MLAYLYSTFVDLSTTFTTKLPPVQAGAGSALNRTRQNASDGASRTPTETVAWAPACIYLDTYMLCGVY